MLHCIYLFFQLIHAFVRKCTNRSAGEKGIGNRSGWERIEPAQLGKELPNLPHGAEGDDYGRKRGVRQWKYVGLGAPLGLGEAEGWMHLLMMHRVWLLPMYLKGSFWQRIGFILGTLTWKTTHPFLFFSFWKVVWNSKFLPGTLLAKCESWTFKSAVQTRYSEGKE